MKDRHRFGTPTLTILAGMTAVCVLSLHSADIAESAEVSGLLSDASHEAFQLSEDAADFESYTRSNSTRGEQTATFGQMKQHVNAANLTLAKLQGVKISASLWQKASIDRLSPLLKELTSDTERLIQLGNGDPLRLTMPEYQDFADANSRVADELATLVADFVSYETARSRLERLFGKLRDLDSEQQATPVAEHRSTVAHASFSHSAPAISALNNRE